MDPLINYQLVKEFLKDRHIKNNLLEVLKQFSSVSDENTNFLLVSIVAICTSRISYLHKESQERLNAIEDCLCYISHDAPTNGDFYYLVRAIKEMYHNAEFDKNQDRNSAAVRRTFGKFIDYFKMVNHELDDKWLDLQGIKDWIYKLRIFVDKKE